MMSLSYWSAQETRMRTQLATSWIENFRASSSKSTLTRSIKATHEKGENVRKKVETSALFL
jgi:hypothetical protein